MDNKLTEYILKHSKKRDKELRYDFMPSLQEIIERPAHIAGTVIIYAIFSLLILAVVWACLAKIDVVVTSQGTVQPIGNVMSIQAYESGIVKAIYVNEGEYVEEGDILIELDSQSLRIDIVELRRQREIYVAQQEVYTKILETDGEVSINMNSYSQEEKTYINAIVETNTNYKNTVASLERAKEAEELNLEIAKLQLKEYESTGTKSQREVQKLVVQQYEATIEQKDLEISNTKSAYNANVNSQLSQINDKLKELDANIEKYDVAMENRVIKAPVNGYVNSVSVNTVGTSVASMQDLITIVPADESMELVCYAKNMDIADIEIGMEAEIKLEAYPYNTYGTVKGKVSYISPSAFMDENLGSVYLVKVSLEEMPDKMDIISGMSGVVEIKTGKRSIMDYFMEPIVKGFGESLKEK